MTTKQGRIMTYLEWLLPIKSHDHIITWSFNIMSYHVINQNNYISINTMSMAINFGRVGIQWGVSFHKFTRSFDHVILSGDVNYFNCCITTNTRSVGSNAQNYDFFSVGYLYSAILSLYQFYLNNVIRKHLQYFSLRKTP